MTVNPDSSYNYIGYTCADVDIEVAHSDEVAHIRDLIMTLVPHHNKGKVEQHLNHLVVRVVTIAQEHGATAVRIAFDEYIEEAQYRESVLQRQVEKEIQ